MWKSGEPQAERPVRLKVYAPNGEVSEVVGWLQLYYKAPPDEKCRMAITHLDEQTVILNGLVVVKDEEKDLVVYDPRRPPDLPPFAKKGMSLLTERERAWLDTHPHWPRELELDWSRRAGSESGPPPFIEEE